MKTIPVGSDATLDKGEAFLFSNTGSGDCQVLNCKPPLLESAYPVAAGGTTSATASPHANPGDYFYTVSPSPPMGNPKIHINS